MLGPNACDSCKPLLTIWVQGDALPRTPAGLLAAVAERLDSVVGLFAAGCGPTATADQYGLRRAVYGMLQVRNQGPGTPFVLMPGCAVDLNRIEKRL